jgi:hypothetical protein
MTLFHGVHPMKISVLALVLTMLFSALAGSLLANLVAANPVVLSLNVDLISPKYGTYNQTVPVAFTYSAPNEAKSQPPNSLPQKFSYGLDGQEPVTFSPEFNGSVYVISISGVSEGHHNLTIHVTAHTFGITYTGSSRTAFFDVFAVKESATGSFLTNQLTVAAIIASAASVSVVSFVLVAYFLRRKRRSGAA